MYSNWKQLTPESLHIQVKNGRFCALAFKVDTVYVESAPEILKAFPRKGEMKA